MWETTLAIFFAFIGGGLASLIYDILKDKRKGRAIRSTLLCEIRVIVSQTTGFVNSFPAEHQYFIQYNATPIFSNYPTIISEFDDEVQQRIYEFYNMIFLLKIRDSDNEYANNQDSRGLFGGAELTRRDSASQKLILRNRIIEIGMQILNN